MHTYINGINENIRKIEIHENREYKLYLIALFEFIILIVLLIILSLLCFNKNKNLRKKGIKEKELPII